jgi:peptidylprolyl isomerase
LGFESLPRSLILRAKLLSLTLALMLAAAVGACGGDDSSDSESAATPSPTDTAAPPAPQGGNVDAIVKGVTKNTKKKPQVVKPAGDPPSSLVTKDIVKGTGPKAKAGDKLTMQYVGVSWSTGEEFDASWDRGQAFPFQLGAQMVIPGWDQGMVGMRQGGRRLLVIPPDLGYGPQGSGPIAPNETLVFLVDLQKLN